MAGCVSFGTTAANLCIDMDTHDERAKLWQAVGTVDDRVSGLEAIVNARTEMMRDSIQAAVREAMPTSLMSDEEYRWVKMAIKRESDKAEFRKKIIESTAIWAIPVLIGSGLVMFGKPVVEYMVAHGMWKP